MYSKSQYNADYNKANYDQIKINVRKSSDIKDRLKLLSLAVNKSRNDLLLEAIELLFEKYDKQ